MARRLSELLEQIVDEHAWQIADEYAWQIVAKEVMPDHVHLFVHVGPTDAPAAVVLTNRRLASGGFHEVANNGS